MLSGLTGTQIPEMQDLARAGHPPVVLLDCLRWLAKFALNAPNPFTSAADKRKLLALKQLYDSGKRPLRNKAANKDPVLVSHQPCTSTVCRETGIPGPCGPTSASAITASPAAHCPGPRGTSRFPCAWVHAWAVLPQLAAAAGTRLRWQRQYPPTQHTGGSAHCPCALPAHPRCAALPRPCPRWPTSSCSGWVRCPSLSSPPSMCQSC